MTKARDIASAAPAPSTVSATELGYLDGVSSAIQTQIDSKQAANANVSTTELGYLDGVTSAIQTQLDGKTAKSTLTTTGDIYYASSANTPARLGIGSTGNVLTVSGGIPAWAAPAGGGKVLQVVMGTTTTGVANSTTTFEDTTLSASITPSSATSKVLVITNNGSSYKSNGNAANEIQFRLMRGATEIAGRISGLYTNTTLNNRSASSVYAYLDEPATTSATTYKTQFRNTNASAAVGVQANDEYSTIILMEIGA